MYKNAKARKLDSPRVYVRNVLLVLEHAINGTGDNSNDIEGKFDSRVDAITNKQDMDQKLDQISRIIDSYIEGYYALLKQSNKDSADAALLSKLEDMIIKFSLEYVELEDEIIEYLLLLQLIEFQ